MMEAGANHQVTALSPVRSSRQIVFLMPDAIARFNRSRKSRNVPAMKYKRQRISAFGPERHIAPRRRLCRFSNRPVEVKHFQTVLPSRNGRHLRAHASLRNWHIGPSILGSKDEVGQSNERPCVAVGRSKRPSGLTSSIVPARDTIPPLDGARASSYWD